MILSFLDRGISTRAALMSKIEAKKAVKNVEISYLLLKEFSGVLSEDEEQAVYEIYRSIQAGDDNTKRTHAGKYAKIDVEVAEIVLQEFPEAKAIRVHDLAVSNGLTSLDFFNLLSSRNNLQYHASDYFDALDVVQIPRGGWQVIFDVGGEPLQYVNTTRGLTISAQKRGTKIGARKKIKTRHSVLTDWFRAWLAWRVLPKALFSQELGANSLSHIPLWHPKFLNAAKEDARLTFGREDIFAPETAPVEVARIMGVIPWMTKSRHPDLLRAVCATLTEGGLLIMGIESQENKTLTSNLGCSIFRRHGDRMVLHPGMVPTHPSTELVLGLVIG